MSAGGSLFEVHLCPLGLQDEIALGAGLAIFVRPMTDWRCSAFNGRRCSCSPLKRSRAPRICFRSLARKHAAKKIEQKNDLCRSRNQRSHRDETMKGKSRMEEVIGE